MLGSELVASAPPFSTLSNKGLHMFIDDVAVKLRDFSTTRTAAVIGIIGAVGGPAAMIAFGGSQTNNLPWYVWVIVLVVLLVVIGWGYHLFTLNHDDKNISISPKRH